MKKHLLKTNLLCFLCLALSTPIFAQDFAWKKGTNLINIAGTYGTMGTPSPINTPGARKDAVSWRDAAGNFWMFGGYGYDDVGSYDHLNDLWKYNPVTNVWTWMGGSNAVNQSGVYGMVNVPAPTNMPGARRYASAWTDMAGNLWLFGGRGYDANGNYGELNDMWTYDVTSFQWKWVKGSNTTAQVGTYGVITVPSSGNVPGARYGSVAWTDAFGNCWLFGGYGHGATAGLGSLNDVWKYNPGTNTWAWMKGSTAVNAMGVYGTQGTAAAANTPGGRTSSAGWTDNAGNFWLHGGYGYSSAGLPDLLSDLWKYNTSTGQWTWYKGYNTNTVQQGIYGTQGSAAPANLPGARYSAITWADGLGDLWLFGGYGFDTGNLPDVLNDLWRYNPASNAWTWVKGSNTTAQNGIYGIPNVPNPFNIPGARSSAVTWKDGSNNLWLFGGAGYAAGGGPGDVHDMWKFFNCINPTVTITSPTATACAGISVTLTANGADTYTWQGNQNTNTITVAPLGTSDYSVKGTDMYECVGTAFFTLTVLNVPSLTTAVTSTMVCTGETTSLSVSGASVYSWSNGDTGSSIAIVTGTTTTFTVTGTDANGCYNTASVTQSVAACVGIQEAELADKGHLVYPNPGNGEFTVKLSSRETARLIIFNSLGQKMAEQELQQEQNTIYSGLPKGVYLYRLFQSGKLTGGGKLVIK
jgi:N-acetylneuraminic acid mutarotase